MGGIRTLRQLALALLVVLAGSLTAATARVAEAEPTKPLGQLIWEEHLRGAQHPERLPLPPADPVRAARDALLVETHGGRTPMQWVDVASPSRLLALREAEPRAADLAAEVARLSGLAGVEQDASQLAARADAVPAHLRAPFAALVATVADAYAEQRLLAGSTRLTDAERDATVARMEAIMASLNELRAAAQGADLAAAGEPIFSDDEGLVILGGEGDDLWRPSGGRYPDPILLVDLGGDDRHEYGAGGACGAALFHACNHLALAVVADLGGADVYAYDGPPAAVQGAGSIGALGMLVDYAGDDLYTSKMTRGSARPFTSYADGVAQGSSNAGLGLLLDAEGADVYRADIATTATRSTWNFAQGWGGYGGYGALADGAGDDSYLVSALGEKNVSRCRDSLSVNCGFIGIYTNGVGFFGGVGVQVEHGAGRDLYRAHAEALTTDYYAQGFGAFGGLGVFLEEAGDDDYAVGHMATDPWIQPLLNCAFGTGSLGGVGVFLELAGNDKYLGYSYAGGGNHSFTMNEGYGGPGAGYGLFVDVSGDDGHFMEAHGGTTSDTFGRGVLIERDNVLDLSLNSEQGGNKFGNYLDLGGRDLYTGAPPSRDNGVWSGGADLELAPSAALRLVLG